MLVVQAVTVNMTEKIKKEVKGFCDDILITNNPTKVSVY